MNTELSVNTILEEIIKLPLDDQAMIAEIVHSRIIEEKRNLLVQSIHESREEYKVEKTSKGTTQDFIKEIDSES